MKLHGFIGQQVLLNNTLKTKTRQLCPSFRNEVKQNGDGNKKGFSKRKKNRERNMSKIGGRNHTGQRSNLRDSFLMNLT